MASRVSILYSAFRDSTVPPAALVVVDAMAGDAMGVQTPGFLVASGSETTVRTCVELALEVEGYSAVSFREMKEVVREGSEPWIDAEAETSPRPEDLEKMIKDTASAIWVNAYCRIWYPILVCNLLSRDSSTEHRVLH